MNARRVTGAVGLVLALVAASCGGSDEAASTTDAVTTDAVTTAVDATTTDVPSDDAASQPLRVAAESDDGEITVEVTASEPAIWLATDATKICSPAEPAVSVFEAVTTGDVGAVRGRFVNEDDRAKVADFTLDDDGLWRLVIGPLEAKRSSKDATFEVTVVALPTSAVESLFDSAAEAFPTTTVVPTTSDATTTTEPAVNTSSTSLQPTTTLLDTGDADDEFVIPDGAATATIDLEMLAPERCGGGRPDRRSTPTPVTLDARVDQSVVVGAGFTDCASRPTSTKLSAATTGKVVAVEASVTLPTGQKVAKSLNGGPRRWQASLGPFPASPSMPASTSVDVVVRATDARGMVHTDTVRVAVARPEPCGGAATTSTAPGSPPTVLGIDGLSVSTSPSPLVVWGTASGGCPGGPTQAQISVTAPSAVTSVTAAVRVGSKTTNSTLTSNNGGAWTGTIGPFPATPSSPASAAMEVRVTASGGGSTTKSLTLAGTLRRPDACGSTSSTTTPTSATTTSKPSSSSSTSTSTTTTTTTTTTAPPPPRVEVRAQASSPVWAVADGFCGGGATTLTISAQTNGNVTQVGAQVSLANGGSQNVQLGGGGGNWSATVGPFPASQQMPDSSGISISVTARDGNGQQASASASSTLRKPGPC